MTTTALGLVLSLTACGEPPSGPAAATDGTGLLRASPVPFPGVFEASGVVHVANSESILFVDDDRPDEIAWMKLDSAGKPVGAVHLISLGVGIADPEGITFDGRHYYVVGSQSARRSGRKVGLVRFTFDSVNGEVGDVQAARGLRELLVAGVSSLPELGETGAKDGLNIEGLAWHFGESTLWLGLRSPRADNDAVLLRLKLHNPEAPHIEGNLEITGSPIQLSLEGGGIRGLEYDIIGDRLLILSGPTEQQGNKPCAVWASKSSGVQRLAYLDSKLKPEGISRRGRNIVIVCDTGMHLTLPADKLLSP